MSKSSELLEPTDFSLVLGGPLYQLFRRAHLSGDALQLVQRRIIVVLVLTWLPLLVLSAAQGQALGGSATIPFLLDVAVHARLLVATPLLIGAELMVHARMRRVLSQFLGRNLIPETAKQQFETAVASAIRWRSSLVAEILLIVLVYAVGIGVVARLYTVLDTSSWYTVPPVTGSRLSLAGMWYAFVSLPAFQFLLLRWYFRMFIWARFLWQVSRIQLSLIPTHPDGVGGLGFLANAADAFLPLAVAHGVMLSGLIAEYILYGGARLVEFKLEIVVLVVFVQCLVFAPLFLFAAQLARVKREGLGEYGALAERYVRKFDTKWLRGGAPADEPLMGSADIQSLADLSNSFEVVQGMRIAPVTRDAVLKLAAATLVPIAPLLLTVVSLEELLHKLVGTLL